MTASTPAVELLRRSFETFNTGDVDACVQLLTPDFIMNMAGAPEPLVGRDAWKQNFAIFREAFPDVTITIDDIFGSDDKVAVRLTFRGTHRGPFLGIQPTGREIEFGSLELYRVEGDLIAEEWVSPDIAALMRQISG